MIFKGYKLKNTINGLNATVEDITRNGEYILVAETILLGFGNTCERPFVKTDRMAISKKVMQRNIDDGTWKVVNPKANVVVDKYEFK